MEAIDNLIDSLENKGESVFYVPKGGKKVNNPYR